MLTQLHNRGLQDTLIVCCDGLNGLPEAIEAIWPRQAIMQTCVIHLMRAAMRYVAYDDQRKKITSALKPIYTAVNETAAQAALEQARADYGQQATPASSTPANAPGRRSSRSWSSTATSGV